MTASPMPPFTSPRHALRLLKSLAVGSCTQRAADLLDEVLHRWPSHIPLLHFAADFHISRGNAELGLAYLWDAVHYHPKSVRALLVLAQHCEDHARPHDAAYALGLLRSLRPDDASILRRLAWQHYRANDLEQAETVFLQLAALTRYEPVNTELLCALLRHTTRHAEFERLIKAQLTRYPDHPLLYEDLAMVHTAQRRMTDAETVLREGLRRHPNCGSLRRLLSIALSHQRRHSEAEFLLREDLQANPANRVSHACLAHILVSTSRHQEALQHIRLALDDPQLVAFDLMPTIFALAAGAAGPASPPPPPSLSPADTLH